MDGREYSQFVYEFVAKANENEKGLTMTRISECFVDLDDERTKARDYDSEGLTGHITTREQWELHRRLKSETHMQLLLPRSKILVIYKNRRSGYETN